MAHSHHGEHDDDHKHPHADDQQHAHSHDSDSNHPHAHDDNDDHPHADDQQHTHSHDSDSNHPHAHGKEHSHDAHSDHDHGHSHGSGIGGLINQFFHFHGHSEQQQQLAADPALATEEGIRAVWLALAALGITTVIQFVIVWLSNSVSLLADTVHNFGDSLNSIPLLMAFYLARRAATRRYTYGFGKAEDIAGIFIVLSIAFSAGYIFWESIQKLLNPTPLTNLPWVAAAAVIGFLGNEAVALLQIRTGRQIGSEALVADGMHARTDGLTSLAVLIAVAGTWLGFPIVDPIIGLLIGVAIIFITRDAAKTMWYRLMDAVDPALVDRIEGVVRGVDGVVEVGNVRMRWLGHQLQADLFIVVDEDLSTRESHQIAEEVRHTLFHDQPHLAMINVHVNPCGHSGVDHHTTTVHHTMRTSLSHAPGE